MAFFSSFLAALSTPPDWALPAGGVTLLAVGLSAAWDTRHPADIESRTEVTRLATGGYTALIALWELAFSEEWEIIFFPAYLTLILAFPVLMIALCRALMTAVAQARWHRLSATRPLAVYATTAITLGLFYLADAPLVRPSRDVPALTRHFKANRTAFEWLAQAALADEALWATFSRRDHSVFPPAMPIEHRAEYLARLRSTGVRHGVYAREGVVQLGYFDFVWPLSDSIEAAFIYTDDGSTPSPARCCYHRIDDHWFVQRSG